MSYPRGFIPVIEEYREFGPTGWLSTTPLMRGDYVPVYMMGQGPPPPLHEVKDSRFFQGFGGFGAVEPPAMGAGDAFRFLTGIRIVDPKTGKVNRSSRIVGTLLQQPNNWPAAETLLIEIAKPGKERDPSLKMSTGKGGLGAWVNYSQLINNTGYLQELKAWYDNFHATGGVAARMQASATSEGAHGQALRAAAGSSGAQEDMNLYAAGGGYSAGAEEDEGFPWLPVVGGVLALGAVVGTVLFVKNKKARGAQSNPSINDVLGL